MSTKYLVFTNPGILSLIDLTTMGDSCKREDSTKIGQFDSGLKYALAILIRNNVDFIIFSGKKEFTFSTEIITDSTTSKSKEVIQITENDFSSGTRLATTHSTAFSPKLGYDWDFWMSVREIYSNSLDEGGDYHILEDHDSTLEYESIACDEGHTTIRLVVNDKLQEVINDWSKYFNVKEPISEYCSYKLYENDDDYLKIYKNNILVYEDEDQKAIYSYGYNNAELDERRVARDTYSITQDIKDAIYKSNDKEFILDFLGKNRSGVLEAAFNPYSVSTTFKEVLATQSTNLRNYYLPKGLKKIIAEEPSIDSHYNMASDSMNSWSGKVIETTPEIKPSFEELVKKDISSFKLDIEVSIVISKSDDDTKVLCNIGKSILFVQESYNTEEHKWQLLKACLRIKSRDNENNLFKYLIKRF